MNENLKDIILSKSKEYFKVDKSGKGFICPVCGSGSGPKGTGITTKDGIHFTCWKGCFRWSDVFDIVGKEKNLQTFSEQLEYLKNYFGIND